MAEWIQMPFGTVSRVTQAFMFVPMCPWGFTCLKGKGLFWGIIGICDPIGLNGQNDVLFAQKCIRLVREKLIIFPYGQYIIGIYVSLAFRGCTQVRGLCWGLRAIGENVTVDTCKLNILLHVGVQWRRHGDHRLVGLH